MLISWRQDSDVVLLSTYLLCYNQGRRTHYIDPLRGLRWVTMEWLLFGVHLYYATLDFASLF